MHVLARRRLRPFRPGRRGLLGGGARRPLGPPLSPPLSEAQCMLSRCHRPLLHVLGPSSPLLTCRPLLPCGPRLMKPLVVFVLGGPGAGKGTQCARIVEVRPGGDGPPSWTGSGRPEPPRRRSAPPTPVADYASRRPPRRPRGRGRGATARCCSGRGTRGHLRGGPLGIALFPRHLRLSVLGTRCDQGVDWERGPGRPASGPRARRSVSPVAWRVRPEARRFRLDVECGCLRHRFFLPASSKLSPLS